MKQVIKANQITLDGVTLPIQGDTRMGCYVEILESFKNQLDAMLSHHCKVIVIRFELHIRTYTPSNERVSKFVRKLRKKLTARYSINRLGYLWVREQERAKHQHYHFAIILDANKVQHPKYIIELIECCWMGWGEPKPFTPKNCYYRISREANDANYLEAFHRVSYLAKTRGKGYKAPTANDYSSSRIINLCYYSRERVGEK